MNRRWVWLAVGWLGLAMNASAEPDGPPPVAVPVTPAAVLPALVSPAPAAGPFDDSRRDALQRQLAIAELELRLAETQAKIVEAQRRATPPAPVAVQLPPPVVVAPPPAPAPAPAAVPAPTPAPVAAAPVVQRQVPAVERSAARTRPGRGERVQGTVGYIAQAGELRELQHAGGARLRAVLVNSRRPLLRPGPGVIADPVSAPALAAADSTAAPAGSRARWQRTLGGGGGTDMSGLGLPPPLPGLPAGGGQP